MRHWFAIDRAWVERRAAVAEELEQRVIEAAYQEARTDHERRFMQNLLAERAANRPRRQTPL